MMEPTFLQIAWFGLFGFLIAGYAILDGFDLGVGVLSLFGRDDGERRLFMNAIGPVWDGNEVWLLTAGGALFAAFPPVYAIVFSGFYLAFMLLLVALIFRAVSLEFRSKLESRGWRRAWDLGFGLGSLVPILLYGVALGNILQGLPFSARGEYTGTFLELLNPYALLCGALSLSMFVCHGALWMAMKSEGDLQERMKRWASSAWMAWVGLFVFTSIVSFFTAAKPLSIASPLVLLAMIGFIGSLVSIPVLLKVGRGGWAFLASATSIGLQLVLVGLNLYPHLVPSLNKPELGLTIANSSSTENSLTIMLVIAIIGMPAVIAYTFFIYRVFRGKVQISGESY